MTERLCEPRKHEQFDCWSMIKFAERLKEARKASGLKQSEVAEHLKIAVRSYQYYEGGRRRPDYETLVELADFLGVTTDYLLGRNDRRD